MLRFLLRSVGWSSGSEMRIIYCDAVAIQYIPHTQLYRDIFMQLRPLHLTLAQYFEAAS